MRRVAGAVGITAMAVYRHFPNREGLLNAVADAGFAELRERLIAVRREGVREALTAVLDCIWTSRWRSLGMFELMFLSMRPGARQFPGDFRAGASPTANVAAELIEEGMRRGVFRRDDVWEITLEMGALLQGMVMLYLGGRIGMEAGEFRALVSSIVSEVLRWNSSVRDGARGWGWRPLRRRRRWCGLGTGLHPVWPLMWVAPLPVLLYALRSEHIDVEARGWWRGWAGSRGAGIFWGYFRLLGIPLVAWFTAIWAGGGGVCRGACCCAGRWCSGGRVWSAAVALPAVWVTFEYVRNLLWPHGSAGSLAYSQLNFLPFLQLASLTGPWGMSFVLLLFPAGLAVAWAVDEGSRRALRMAGATVGVVAAVLVFGAVRLAMRQPGPAVRVGLVTSDASGNVGTRMRGRRRERLIGEYAAAGAGADRAGCAGGGDAGEAGDGGGS